MREMCAGLYKTRYTLPMQKPVLGIVGLGYVGLPLAVAFAKKGYEMRGFDISERRIKELSAGKDRTGEISDEVMKTVTMQYSTDPTILGGCDVVIMAIPTPVDEHKKPDLTPVIKASETVGKHMKKGAIIVYESTVYPGTTEEICGPILEKMSGMKCGVDFTLGYSPERINPGDKEHTVEKIMKIVSGQDEKTTDALCELYGSVITAGIHRAANIKTAEMAKAIENAQRDLNIAFVNEIAMLCHKIGISTPDVLTAAGTKWNFLKFQPGLVGGHCIGVDPYYLVEKAEMLGMKTKVIAAGREINDGMAQFVADETLAALGGSGKGKRMLALGLTFKEDIPDTRNSQSHNVIHALMAAGCDVVADDPHVVADEWSRMPCPHGTLKDGPYDAILLLVKHKEFTAIPEITYIAATKKGGVVYDLKSVLDGRAITASGRTYIEL